MLRFAPVLTALLGPCVASLAWAAPVTSSLDTTLEQTAPPASARKYELAGSAGLSARDQQQYLNSAQVVRFKLDGHAAYKFTSRFRVDTLLEGAFDNGRTQSGAESSSSKNKADLKNGLDVREAALSWTPWDVIQLRAGAISQDYLDAPLLFYRTTFPAVTEALMWETSRFRFVLAFEQAIPTASTMATQATEREAMPRLAMESFKATAHVTRSWDIETSAHRFSLFDLPSAAAEDSRMGGNTVDGDKDARFRYGFQGYVLGLSTHLHALGFPETRLGGQYLKNPLAPEGHNMGYLGFNEWLFRLNSRLDFLPRYTYFYNESDSSPAYYNSWAYGHNNTFGHSLDLAFHLKQLGFTAGGRMTQSRNLVSTPFQNADEINHVYMLTLETDYASL